MEIKLKKIKLLFVISSLVLTPLVANANSNYSWSPNIFGGRNFVVVDNNEPAEDVNPTVYKRIRNMVDRAPTSYQAVKWIHRQLEKKKRK